MSNLASNARNKFERKLSGKWSVRVLKGFALFIANDNLNDFINNGSINWKSYWNNKTWNRKEEGEFLGALLAPFVASIVHPLLYSVAKGLRGRGFRRAGRRYINFGSAPSFKQYRDYLLFQLQG